MNLAREGEDMACRYLQRKGFKILDKNYRTSLGELDIVARKDDLLVFCEVKTRSNEAYGKPFEAVTPFKQRRLRRLAEAYLLLEKPDFERARFDVISIDEGEIEHIENAF